MSWKDPLLPHHTPVIVSTPPKKKPTPPVRTRAYPRPAPVTVDVTFSDPTPAPVSLADQPLGPCQPQGALLKKTVRIIVRDNSVGLGRDRDIIERAFFNAGWAVHYVEPDDQSRELLHVAVNVHLEMLATRLLATADTNIVIPNAEGWNPEWTEALQHPSTVVWCKTNDAYQIFGNLGAHVERLGFESVDQRVEGQLVERAFLHVSGGSSHKNTELLVSMWKESWLPLTVVSAPEMRVAMPSNVTLLGRVSEETLQRLQNQHAFHIYPSTYEGFGHALWEGLSCGAVVFAPHSAPFNVYTNTFRLLSTKKQTVAVNHIAVGSEVTKKSVEGAVAWAKKLTDAELMQCREASRDAWQRNATAFEENIHTLIGTLASRD